MLEGKSEASPDDLFAGLLKVKHIIKGDSQEHTYFLYQFYHTRLFLYKCIGHQYDMCHVW